MLKGKSWWKTVREDVRDEGKGLLLNAILILFEIIFLGLIINILVL